MKTLIVLILCHVLVLQGRTSEDCKFWPYWYRCETKQSLSRETSCCSVLERIFGGKCPEFCTTDICIDAPQKISTWCGLTQNNTNNGMSCETGVLEENWKSRKNETKIYHSCCEPLNCTDETEKQCYGDFGENVITIYLRKTCCTKGYSGWTCSGNFIRDTTHTTKPGTSKPSTLSTTTTTGGPTTSSLSATGELSTEHVGTQESDTKSTHLPNTPVASTTVIGKGTVTIKSPVSTLTPINQNSQGQNIANTVTLVGGVVGGLLGGVLVLLIWRGCRQRRQMHTVEGATMPMTPRHVVVPAPRIEGPAVIPDVCKRDPMPLPDDVYSNPYEEILADPVPRYTSVENLQNELPNYLLGGLSQIGRGDTDESAQSTREESSRLYFVLEDD